MFTKSTRLVTQLHAFLSKPSQSNIVYRCYSDLIRRRAMRVLTAAEAEDYGRQGFRRKDTLYEHSVDESDLAHESDILPSGMRFEKLHELDKRLNPVIHAIKHKNIRERKNFVMLEGARLIKDAMSAGAKVKYLYFTKLELLKDFPLEQDPDIRLYKLKTAHLKLWSNLVMPPGVVAICEKPKEDQLQLHQEELLPLTLICDNIRDPGNIGSMLRVAAAVGCKKVLATKGCVDVWDPKVIRAAAGSHFSVSIVNNVDWQQVENYLAKDAYICLADSKETRHLDERLSVPFRTLWQAEFKCPRHAVLVVGGETHGLSKAAYELAKSYDGDRIHIPVMPSTESLNAAVAAAVIMFEIRKQMLQKIV